MTTKLFDSLTLRELTLRNRVVLPPMCQYSVDAEDGVPTEWHRVHYGARAAGGFGLIIVEATGVVPEGRISPRCLGLWNDEQATAFKPIVDFAHSQGAAIGIQLAHAGRKGSTYPALPQAESGSVPMGDGGWETLAPSAEAFPGLNAPRELSANDIHEVIEAFAAAAQRAVDIGFDTVEIHAAHGYLIHQFLSPLSNKRDDEYGGDFAGRTLLLRQIVSRVREVIPSTMPLLVRISATDWIEDEPAWTTADSIRLVKELREDVDMIDVSTGGYVMARIPVGPGYQATFATEIALETGVPVVAVGRIEFPELANYLVENCHIDAVAVGSQALVDPAWPAKAAEALGVDPLEIGMAPQYHRGRYN